MSFRGLGYFIRSLRSSLLERGLWKTLKLVWSRFLTGGLLQALAARSNYERDYRLWLKKNRPSAEDLMCLEKSVKQLKLHPLISVIMPVYNTPEKYLIEAIGSVMGQMYRDWELCIADDCSSSPKIRQVLETYQTADNRIKVVFRNRHGHISAATNSAIRLATGEYLAFLDHDDLLTPDALCEVAILINQHPDADLIYTDEDKLDQSGTRITPYFKPDWSPDNLLTRMYTLHLSVFRRKIVEEIGGFRLGFEGSQDHDLALRFVEKTHAIYHLPKILYHWRMHSESAALNVKSKSYASETGRKAIEEAIYRRGEPGMVEELPDYRGRYRVRYVLKESALISIIVPTRDFASTLQKCLNSIFTKSSYKHFEVLQIDNSSEELETRNLFQKWGSLEPDRYRVVECNIPFNFSKLNNIAVQHARGDYLLFLNNDTEVISNDWLEALLEQAQRVSVGAVGAKLFYPDETIQHAGLILGLGDLQTAGHIFQGYSDSDGGYFGNLCTTSNYSALTAACLMCKKENFTAVGGFDERLGIAYNDVDLCLKFREQGLNNVFLPHVRLYHHESKSRGYEDTDQKRNRLMSEANILKEKWGAVLVNDPYYNPNLSKKSKDFRINLE